jgi:hypothetical protein
MYKKTIPLLLILILILISSISASATTLGNCFDHDEKLDFSSEHYEYDAPTSYIIDEATLKAGTECYFETVPGCYIFEGVGTDHVEITRIGDGPDCKQISHVELGFKQIEKTVTPTLVDPTNTPTFTDTVIPTDTNTPDPTHTNTLIPPTATKTHKPQPSKTPHPTNTVFYPTGTQFTTTETESYICQVVTEIVVTEVVGVTSVWTESGCCGCCGCQQTQFEYSEPISSNWGLFGIALAIVVAGCAIGIGFAVRKRH